jgi:hypothetical protein
VAIERGYHWFSYRLMVEPNPSIKVRVLELVEEIFSDIWVMDPDEPALINSYIRSIEDPFGELKSMGMTFFTIQECRDVFIKARTPGERHPVEDITYGHFFLIPTYGCFREDHARKTGPLHLISSACDEAVRTLLGVVRKELEVGVAINAIFGLCADSNPEEFLWCDVCFPKAEDGSRLSLEYLQKITSLTANELTILDVQGQTEISQVQ